MVVSQCTHTSSLANLVKCQLFGSGSRHKKNDTVVHRKRPCWNFEPASITGTSTGIRYVVARSEGRVKIAVQACWRH